MSLAGAGQPSAETAGLQHQHVPDTPAGPAGWLTEQLYTQTHTETNACTSFVGFIGNDIRIENTVFVLCTYLSLQSL